MGLDMYLYKRTYVSDYKRVDKGSPFAKKMTVKITREFENGDKDEETLDVPYQSGVYIERNAIYWRKANAIHRWFVEEVQNGVDDCGDYNVSADQLKVLLLKCEKVLKDKNSAPSILPTQDGFFFGDTNYNDSYFEVIEYTVKKLKELDLDNSKDDYTYHSSW